MTDSRLLICTSLHLPPDPQPFLHINEISGRVFLSNIDRLRLALEATRYINPEAVQIFSATRKVLCDKLLEALQVLFLGQSLAERYLLLLESLLKRKPIQCLLSEVNLRARLGMLYAKDGQKAMSVFWRELEKAVRQVTMTMSAEHKKVCGSSLTSPKNLRLVLEVLCAIDECNRSLQQCHHQFAKLAAQTEDENSIGENPPSEEEIWMIGAKWQTYFDIMKSAWDHGGNIAIEIQHPSSSRNGLKNLLRRHKIRQGATSWRALFQRRIKQDSAHSAYILEVPSESTDSGARVDAMGVILKASKNTGVPSVISSIGPRPNNLRTPFGRKFFRRTNSDNLTAPESASGKLQASGDHPPGDIPVPPPKAAFWRQFSRYTFQRHYFDRV